MDLTAQLRAFRPWNEQEARDRDALLRLLELGQAPCGREDPAHLTASAWVVSPDRKQVLLAYHDLYDSWAWLGGHADGDRDLLAAALREAREESGLEEEFIRSCLENSEIETGVIPEPGSQVLTLSTCTGQGYDTRWVVQGVLACRYAWTEGPE